MLICIFKKPAQYYTNLYENNITSQGWLDEKPSGLSRQPSLNLGEEGGSLTSKDLKYNWCNCDHVKSNYNATGQVTAAIFYTIFPINSLWLFTRES